MRFKLIRAIVLSLLSIQQEALIVADFKGGQGGRSVACTAQG